MSLTALFTLAAALSAAPGTAQGHPERPAVEKPLQAYFRYHQTGDPKGLAEAFHPQALLQWAKGGERQVLDQKTWQAQAAEKLAQAQGPRKPVRCEIVWMEIEGDAAVAKVHLDYPTFRFIDYMHLIKLKDGWKIVDKIYHRQEGAVAR